MSHEKIQGLPTESQEVRELPVRQLGARRTRLLELPVQVAEADARNQDGPRHQEVPRLHQHEAAGDR
jgi:hypothetical protein